MSSAMFLSSGLPPYDSLPGYESSVFLKSELYCKTECVDHHKRSFNRRWQRVSLELNNTQITICPCGFGAGKTYSLQYGQVGFACDYKKGLYPIRLRAGGKQFLIECEAMLKAVQWIQAIEFGIGISLPLDYREEPPAKYKNYMHNSRHRADTSLRQEKASDSASCSISCGDLSTMIKDNLLVDAHSIPKNAIFNLCDFGIILKHQQWITLPH